MKTSLLVLVLSAVLVGCQAPPTTASSGGENVAYGVYTDLGTVQLPMQPGSNLRTFDTVNEHGDGHISHDQNTGYVTLQPGTYRVDGTSITTFGYLLSPDAQAAVRSVPGYAYLFNVDTGKIGITGTMQEPMYSLASDFSDVLVVTAPTRFALGHQNGQEVEGLLLESYDATVTTSTNHVFGRLVVERLGD